MSRGGTEIRNPAEAIAMSKCWLATWVRHAGASAQKMGIPAVDSFHPGKCAYCDEPRDYLIRALERFRDWSGISSDDAPLRLEIESFQTLPAHEQTRLVRKAQLAIEEPKDARSPW